jgi:MFS family permease
MLGAVTVVAQAPDEGDLLEGANGSVLVGIQKDVTLAAGEEADAVLVIDGNGLIEGTTGGLLMVDADVTIQGSGASVDGIFAVGGSLTIGPGATVTDLAYIDTALTVDPTATLENERNIETDLTGAAGWIFGVIALIALAIWIGGVIATIVAGLFVVAFGTSQSRRAAQTIGQDVLKVIVAGLLMIVLPWIVFGLLFVTVIGIPLAIGLALLWGVLAFLGYLVVALWIGERVLRRARQASRPYGAMFLGIIILVILALVPGVNAIVGILTLLFGMGAVTLAGWRVLRSGGTPPYVAPPAWGTPYPQYPQYGQPPQGAPQWGPPPYTPQGPPPGQWPPQGGPPSNWPG